MQLPAEPSRQARAACISGPAGGRSSGNGHEIIGGGTCTTDATTVSGGGVVQANIPIVMEAANGRRCLANM
jgi:hypothetical protein